ncbi:MAG: hypothetical protein M3439_06510 [Chloroflexota bacterium]|nr:hypothetical protein [Chloroflexota bacterium]
MIALVKNNLEATSALCREFGVVRLELFGSAATGEFDGYEAIDYPTVWQAIHSSLPVLRAEIDALLDEMGA